MWFKPHMSEFLLKLLENWYFSSVEWRWGQVGTERMSLLCSSVRELHPTIAGNFCPLENSASTQHLVFQMALLCSIFFPSAFQAQLADLPSAGQVTCPIGHAASEHFDPCPYRWDQFEALLLPVLRSVLQALEAGCFLDYRALFARD